MNRFHSGFALVVFNEIVCGLFNWFHDWNILEKIFESFFCHRYQNLIFISSNYVHISI